MKKTKTNTEKERMFVKYYTSNSNGVEAIRLTRNAIGFIIRGEKFIYEGDNIHLISQGEIFFMPHGTHYIENIQTSDESFEQIICYYLPSQIQQIIAKMEIPNELLEIEDKTRYPRRVVSATPSRIMRNHLIATSRHYEYGGFHHNPESERVHLMQILLSILSHEEEAIKRAVLRSIDINRAEFEKVIYDNLFDDKSVDELAGECSRSLTSFKKEFKEVFGMPPHQWHMSQRLACAKLLLRTTSKSVSQIGNESAFPNTSHFIKLFKRHFGDTPAIYRAKCGVNNIEPTEPIEIEKIGDMEAEEMDILFASANSSKR